ncbi:hypothetical protein KSS87_008180, partial [Heliosperma pusillum]
MSMAAKTVKSNSSSIEDDKHRHMDREIKDMISALTTRLGRGGHRSGAEDESGASIITLAGSNTGATMRGDLLGRHENHDHDQEDLQGEELDGLDTYVNNNFQGVNNSIMFEASYSSNDPGVHVVIDDVLFPHGHQHDKRGKKEAKKGKEEELRSLEDVQPNSRCCKELNEYLTAKSDPLIAAGNQKTTKSDSSEKRSRIVANRNFAQIAVAAVLADCKICM